MDYPFLFINHGVIDPDYIDKCEEMFLWFARDVTAKERKAIEKGCPSPLQCFWHWDRTFCYFGSEGDTYDHTIMMDYAPEAVQKVLATADPVRAAKEWNRAYQIAMDHLGASVEAFSRDVERWALEVHAKVPIAALWGPNGADEDDPWHRWSTERFAGAMSERVASCRPESAAGRKYLGYIRNMCGDLLEAPKKVAAPKKAAPAKVAAPTKGRARS